MSSTQAYYKDRLGFDPKEVLYDGAPPEKHRRTSSSTTKLQGYEENLSKFKGTIWDMFIESKGTVAGSVVFRCRFSAWFFRFGVLLIEWFVYYLTTNLIFNLFVFLNKQIIY